MYQQSKRQAFHYSMNGYLIPLWGDIVILVGPPPPPSRILTTPILRVCSWYVRQKNSYADVGRQYHTCVRATTSDTSPKIRQQLIK